MSHSKIRSKKKKQNRQIELLQDIRGFLAGVLDGLVSIYMLLIIVVMPFYFTDGYSKIGTNKYEFFYGVSSKMSWLVLPIVAIYIVFCLLLYLREEKKPIEKKGLLKTLSLTDWCALGYGLVTVVSYLCSEYREATPYGDAWKGSNGWYMGLFSQLTFVAIYFLVSRFWKRHKWVPALWFPVTLVVFVLGYLNRFDARPIEMTGANISFISTIGNINWYCGYIIIVLMGMLYYIWSEEAKKSWVRIAMLVWLGIGFATLLTQGSQSGYLALAGGLVVLYFLSMKDIQKLQALGSTILCLGLACVGTWFLRTEFKERFNFTDTLNNLFTDSFLAVIVLIIGFILAFLVPPFQKKGILPIRLFTILGYAGGALAVAGILSFLIIGVVNTTSPEGLAPIAENNWFIFDKNWGSRRGATWAAAFTCLKDQSLWKKIIGVGPDCMAMYIHSGVNEELVTMVKESFGNLTLTNAHNEWLTIWVNCGLLGLLTYAGMMVSAIVRFIKGGKYSVMAGACGFGVLAYTINNMVSFQQAMSAATVFVVLGMGEAYLRGEKLK
ncbi:MAG: O-antigen ligase family protein [Lachnospiraceae bacterium]|nr:O-antigen ligase family protein [Lachnospiraceae bacterium]